MASLKQLLKSLVFLLVIIVNYLATALPIGGRTTKDVSDYFDNRFVPAGFTFSIWGIIYLLLLVYLVLSLRDSRKNANTAINDATTNVFIITGILNVSWLICWQFLLIVPSFFIMLALLVNLVFLDVKLSSTNTNFRSKLWYYRYPFAVYLAWISVAMIANTAALCVALGLDFGALGNEIAASILIVIAALLGVVMAIKKQNTIFGVVIMWAVYGIYSKQSSMSHDIIVPTALTAIGITGLAVIYGRYKSRVVKD